MMDPPQSHAVPKGVSVQAIDGGLMISRSWRNLASWGLLPIFLALCGIIIALFRATHLSEPDHPARWFPLGFAVVGLVFFYGLLFRMFNVTRIRITADQIRVKHGPVPWKAGVSVPTGKVRGFRVSPVEISYSSRRALHWHLIALCDDGRETLLLAHDVDRDQARFIAAALHQVTGRPVEEIQAPGH